MTTPKETWFVNKFRHRLLAERERRVAAARAFDREEVRLVGRALGVEEPGPVALTGPEAERVAAILASPRAGTFRRLVNDYYELIGRGTGDPDRRHGAGG